MTDFFPGMRVRATQDITRQMLLGVMNSDVVIQAKTEGEVISIRTGALGESIIVAFDKGDSRWWITPKWVEIVKED